VLQPEPDPHRYDDPTAVVSSLLAASHARSAYVRPITTNVAWSRVYICWSQLAAVPYRAETDELIEMPFTL